MDQKRKEFGDVTVSDSVDTGVHELVSKLIEHIKMGDDATRDASLKILINRIKTNQDDYARNAVIELFLPEIKTYVRYRNLTRADSEDTVNEIVVKLLHENFSTFTFQSYRCTRRWVISVAVNHMNSESKKRKKALMRSGELNDEMKEQLACPEQDPEEKVRMCQAVNWALKCAGDSNHSDIILTYLKNDISYEEVAKRNRKSLSQVKKILAEFWKRVKSIGEIK